jgi:hypothetical protein
MALELSVKKKKKRTAAILIASQQEVKRNKTGLLSMISTPSLKNLHISISIAVGYGMDDEGFESWQRLGIFLFTTASRRALGPT